MENYDISELVGWLAKVFVCAMVFLGIIYVIAILVRPVIEAVGETISMFGSGGYRDIHWLAILCILFIGAIGLAKVLTRNKR